MAQRMDPAADTDQAPTPGDTDVDEPAEASSPRPGSPRSADREPVLIPSNGSAIAALVVGMSAATYAFFAVSAAAAVVAGITAVILGIRGVSIAKRYGGLHKGLAVSGIVTGALGLLLGLAVIAGSLTLFQNMDDGDLPPELQRSLNEATG